MLPFILVSLIVALLVVALVAIVIFFRAAFWGEEDIAKETRAVLTWRPPFMRGGALRDWAATTAEELARIRLTGKRTGVMAVQLATEVEEGAVHAMLPLAKQAELERIVACPETGQGMVALTAPEALAIAAHLRKNRSQAEQRRIHDLAVANSKKILPRTGDDSDLPPLPCPLQAKDNVCYAYAARPLGCRPLHAMSVAKGMGCRSVQLSGSQAETPGEEQHEQSVAQGIEIGLTRALKSAGLDANVYELNSALAKALETHDAAGRWANGENIFDPCRLVGAGRNKQVMDANHIPSGLRAPATPFAIPILFPAKRE